MTTLGLPSYPSTTATLLLIISVALTLADNPEHHAVGIISKSVSLPCPTIPADLTSKLQWADFVYNTDRNPKIIYDAEDNTDMHVSADHPRRKSYSLDRKYTLTITDVTMDDAGLYFCRIKNDDGSFTDLRKHRLAVMGTPKCSGTTSLKEGGSTDLSCEVLANSNEVPNLQWLFGGQTESGDDQSTLEVFKTSLPVTTVTWAEDQQVYMCNVSIAGKSASCELKLDVQYPVRDIQITPMKDSYAVGDRVKCEAKGNPAPTIEWEPPVKGKMGRGFKSFVIPEEWKGKSQSLKCTASNVVDTKTTLLEENISFIPTGSENEDAGPKPEDSSKGAEPKPIKTLDTEAAANTNGAAASTGGIPTTAIIIGAAIGAVVLIMVIVAIIVARRKSNKKKKGHMQIPTSDHEDVKKPIDAKGGSPGSRTTKGADRNSNGIASYQQGGRYPAYITSTPEDLDPDTPWRRQSEAV